MNHKPSYLGAKMLLAGLAFANLAFTSGAKAQVQYGVQYSTDVAAYTPDTYAEGNIGADNSPYLSSMTSSDYDGDTGDGFSSTVAPLNDTILDNTGSSTPGENPNSGDPSILQLSGDFTVTFTFNQAVNVSELVALTAWPDERSGQEFTVQYETAGSDTFQTLDYNENNSFVPLNTFAADNLEGGAWLGTVSDASGDLLTNVTAVQFTIEPIAEGNVYQELEVIGAPVVPEPSTWALMLGGLSVVILMIRHTRALRP